MARPPPLAPARDPSAWVGAVDAAETIEPRGEATGIDPLAEAEYLLAQRLTW